MSALTGFLAGSLAFTPINVDGLFIDGFAGGGGASTGIEQAIGRSVDIAVNHSETAIAIHRANHPATEHHCTDIRLPFLPAQAVRGRPVAGAWFSPDCKEFSKAKGGPVKDRSIRALCWEVVHWLKETRPTCGYLENVEEFEYAAPLDADGMPIKGQEGREFKRFVRAIRALGYRVQWRILKACDYGAPTSRKRLYMVMRCDGLPIVWPKPTHGAPGSVAVRSGKLQPWRTAAECIDWSIPCPSIFDRKRELAEATKRRIAHGVMRYVVNAAEPFIVPVTHQGAVRVHSVGEPFRTITAAHRGELMASDVELSQVQHTDFVRPPHLAERPSKETGAPLGMDEGDGRSRWEHPALMAIPNLSSPFVSYGQQGGRNRAATDPLHTATASSKDTNGVVEAVLAPHVTKYHGTGVGCDLGNPMPTVTANGSPARPAGATPLGFVGATLVRTGHGDMDASGKRRGKGWHDLTEPAPTVSSSRDEALAAATLVQMGYGEREGQQPRVPHLDKPLGTIVAGGGKSAAVTAFLSSFYGSDKRAAGGDPEQPLRTARAGGQHHSVITAHIEQANGGPRNRNLAGRDARRPLSTATTTGAQQRVVETTLIEEGALPPEQMARAVQVAAFLVKYYGTNGEGETAQSQAADRPLDTVTTLARFAVVTVTIDAQTYVIVDIGLRMLKPRELARAQGFPDDYKLDPIVRKFLRGKWVERPLTIAEQINAIGNSVCPPVARALVLANQPSAKPVRMAA